MKTVKVKVVKEIFEEKNFNIPIIHYYDNDKDFCDLMDVDCQGTACIDCIFSYENFEAFKSLMNNLS